MPECQSCREDRAKQKLSPVERTRLPAGITDARNFRHPEVPTFVCAHCDGETLIASALRSFAARQGT